MTLRTLEKQQQGRNLSKELCFNQPQKISVLCYTFRGVWASSVSFMNALCIIPYWSLTTKTLPYFVRWIRVLVMYLHFRHVLFFGLQVYSFQDKVCTKEELGLIGFCILVPKAELPDVLSQTLSSGIAQMVCCGLTLSRQMIARQLEQMK